MVGNAVDAAVTAFSGAAAKVLQIRKAATEVGQLPVGSSMRDQRLHHQRCLRHQEEADRLSPQLTKLVMRLDFALRSAVAAVATDAAQMLGDQLLSVAPNRPRLAVCVELRAQDCVAELSHNNWRQTMDKMLRSLATFADGEAMVIHRCEVHWNGAAIPSRVPISEVVCATPAFVAAQHRISDRLS